MIRLGWIGCGRHATEMLLPQIARLPLQLAAICDRDEANLARTAASYGVTSTYRDAEAMLAHPGLDAVGMAVGPELHVTLSVAALARGLPMFMEKPPGADVAGAEAIAAAAAKAGKPVALGFMKRYSTGNRIAHSVLSAEEFGPRIGFLGHYMTAPTYFAGNVDYTGFYLHHCVHYMDLVPWLMGPVSALRTRRVETAPGKLLLHLDFEFESGGIGTLAMGTIQARSTPMEFIQVMGDHRRVEVRNVDRVAYYRAPTFKVSDPAATLDGAQDTLTWEPNLTVAANEDHKGYHAILSQFVALLEGRPTDIPQIADGVRAMRLLEAMIRGAASGEVVRP